MPGRSGTLPSISAADRNALGASSLEEMLLWVSVEVLDGTRVAEREVFAESNRAGFSFAEPVMRETMLPFLLKY